MHCTHLLFTYLFTVNRYDIMALHDDNDDDDYDNDYYYLDLNIWS